MLIDGMIVLTSRGRDNVKNQAAEPRIEYAERCSITKLPDRIDLYDAITPQSTGV
jgi:hypothetical protein